MLLEQKSSSPLIHHDHNRFISCIPFWTYYYWTLLLIFGHFSLVSAILSLSSCNYCHYRFWHKIRWARSE